MLGQAVPAVASARVAAVMSTARNLYLDYLSRQAAARVSWPDRPELPRDDGPDMTQDAFVPYIVTGAGPSAPSTPHYPFYSAAYGALPVGRQDEIPHNELPDPSGYPGDWAYMGTAPTLNRAGPHPAGAYSRVDGWERYGDIMPNVLGD